MRVALTVSILLALGVASMPGCLKAVAPAEPETSRDPFEREGAPKRPHAEAAPAADPIRGSSEADPGPLSPALAKP